MTTLTWDRHRGHAIGYDVVAHGFNYRLDELHAALGRCQLEKLPGNNARRRDLVAVYRRALAAIDSWIVPFANHQGDSAFHLSVAVAPNRTTRDGAIAHLRAAGIQTSLHYPSVPTFRAFQHFRDVALAHAEAFASRAITLPLFPTMSVSQVEAVCEELAVAVAQGSRSDT